MEFFYYLNQQVSDSRKSKHEYKSANFWYFLNTSPKTLLCVVCVCLCATHSVRYTGT